MENPDLVLQETGSRPTYSRLNYVPSGDTLRRDAISSFILFHIFNIFIAFQKVKHKIFGIFYKFSGYSVIKIVLEDL